MKLWTLEEIAEVSGFSLSFVKKAAYTRKSLKLHYVDNSPRVLHSELVEWLGTDPLEGDNVTIEISKTVKQKDRTTTTTTRIERDTQLQLFNRNS